MNNAARTPEQSKAFEIKCLKADAQLARLRASKRSGLAKSVQEQIAIDLEIQILRLQTDK